MFFMMGITDGRKDFEWNQLITCDVCGAYGRLQAFMTYTVLTLFLIPCLKWNRRYYVRAGCCGTVYEIDPEIGRRIARGEEVEIDLGTSGRMQGNGYQSCVKRCSRCGYVTDEEFAYCPMCGQRF